MSTMEEIEEESKAAAEKMVMNMMQRPGQLEKVQCYTNIRKDRNKYRILTVIQVGGYHINLTCVLLGRAI